MNILFKRLPEHTLKYISKKIFTLVELLIVIAVIAILATLLFPSLSTCRNKVKEISCKTNLKQIAIGLDMYSGDNQNYYPTGYASSGTIGTNRYWLDLLHEYVNAKIGPSPSPRYLNTVYECKMDNDRKIGGTEFASYIYVYIFWRNYSTLDIFTPRISAPASIGIITDGIFSSSYPSYVVADIEGGRNGNCRLRPRHSLSTNILHCDGHVSCSKAIIGQSLESFFTVP